MTAKNTYRVTGSLLLALCALHSDTSIADAITASTRSVGDDGSVNVGEVSKADNPSIYVAPKSAIPSQRQIFRSGLAEKVIGKKQIEAAGPGASGNEMLSMAPGVNVISGYTATGGGKTQISINGVKQGWHIPGGAIDDGSIATTFDGVPMELHDSHYVPHHNPFQYYQRWYDYVRQGHMRSANDFVDDARSGKLPPVSFIKAAGPHSEHPGEDTPMAGMNWVESLLKAVSEGPAWGKTAIFITYDEGGGFWDSAPPPQLDAFGLGTRTPALLVSPFSRSGLVDHHLAHTGSILKFIETRFGLDPLTERDREAYDMLAAFDFDQTPKALL